MSDSFFDKYVNPSGAATVTREKYEAFSKGSGGQQIRLRFVDKEGYIYVMSYSYLTQIVATSHQLVSLIYTNCVFTLSGSNLLPIIDFLQDDKIRTIRAFHPNHYIAPAADEMKIDSIVRQTIGEVMIA